jgi:mono/diheme cytochrome c family protein
MRAILPALVAVFFSGAAVQAADPVFTDQGPSWTQATRDDFYSRDQGSRMIPLPWLQALKQPNGQPFLEGSLARYGYLPNPASSNGLPVGFTASGATGLQVVGMTCSACHTRQITANDQAYRIDGGPAIVDFQSLLSDLDTAVGQVLASDAAFSSFASAVLSSPTPDADDVTDLRKDVDAWYQRYHTLMTRALPTPGWGPSRLDAVGMIFDRLTGLDLGAAPNFIIADNIQKADAPVRYPFIWNAPIQDHTQWTGFADNGSDVLALSRNLGEVFGVFGVFQPSKDRLLVNFLNNNSANFDGLGKLENLVKKIGPPKWPQGWPIDATLAAQGEQIYLRSQAEGGCADCHGIKTGQPRIAAGPTWATPIDNVGTDTHAHDILAWSNKKTGVLQGAFIPFATKPLGQTDQAFNILATSVIGSIAEQALRGDGASPNPAALVATGINSQIENAENAQPLQLTKLPPALRDLQGAFHAPAQLASSPLSDFRIQGQLIPNLIAPATPLPPKGAYEARVLQGIWAAAPYLHNGSVPTLAELLKPAAQRVKQFKIGPAYDPVNVGLAVEQPQFDYTVNATDCSDLGSGNSNCGHEFGTQLTDSEKKALLEYLKTL